MTVSTEYILGNGKKSFVELLVEECKHFSNFAFPDNQCEFERAVYKTLWKNNLRISSNELKQVYIPQRGGKIKFISHEDISCLESVTKKEQTTIYLSNGNSLFASKALGYFEKQLSGFSFIRVHRQYIVNINSIDTFRHIKNEGEIILKNGHRVQVSRRKKDYFLEYIRQINGSS